MEDIAKIGFQADTSGLVKAKKELEKIPPAAKEAEKASDKLGRATGKMSDKMLEEMQIINKNIARLVDGMSRGFKSAENSITSSIKQLNLSVNTIPTYTAKAVAGLNQLGVAATGAGAKFLPVSQQFRKVDREFNNIQGSMGNYAAQFNDIGVTAAMGMSPLLIALQQGTQLTQGFAGQSAKQALKGLGGAFLSILSPISLVTIALIQWVAGAFTAEGETVKLKDQMTKLNEGIDNYEKFMVRARNSTYELSEEFGNFAGRIKGFSEYMAGVALGQTFDDLKSTVVALNAPLSAIKQQFANLVMAQDQLKRMDSIDTNGILMAKDAVALYQDQLDESAAALGLNATQALQLANAIDEIAKAKGITEIAEKSANALELMKQLVPVGQDLPAPLREAALALEEMASKAASAETATTGINRNVAAGYQLYAKTKTEANQLADKLVLAGLAASNLSLVNFGNIDEGAAAALRIAGRLGIAYNEAVSLMGVFDRLSANPDERGSQRQTVKGANTRNPNQPWLETYNRGGWIDLPAAKGGGGAAKKAVSELQAISEELKKLSEPFEQAQSAVKALQIAYENGIIGNEKYAASVSTIEAAFLRAGGSAAQWAVIVGNSVDSISKQIKDLQKSSIEGLGDALATLAVEGSADFGQLARSIVKDLIRIALQAAVIEPLLKALGLSAPVAGAGVTAGGAGVSAQAMGGVISGGQLQPFAKGGAFTNQVVTQPTLFAFAKGGALGLMGEAGPEAIMPLSRARDGSLGVQMVGAAGGARGDGNTMIVQVINNADGTAVRTERQQNSDGTEIQRIIIDTVNEGKAQGKFDAVDRARNNTTVTRIVR